MSSDEHDSMEIQSEQALEDELAERKQGFDQLPAIGLGPARGVDGAVSAGDKRLQVVSSAVDKRLQDALSAACKVRASSEAVADAKAKGDIIQASIRHVIDVASELYARTKDELRELSKKEISLFAHRAFNAEKVRLYFPDLSLPMSSNEQDSMEIQREQALEDELAERIKEPDQLPAIDD
jgi:hypothetical protein